MAVESCEGCGLCCMGQNLLPLSGAGNDEREIYPELLAELLAIARGSLFGDDGCPCVWLNRATGRCLHHDFRPSLCRELLVGGVACLRIRRLAGFEE